jgi:hypothetical protein
MDNVKQIAIGFGVGILLILGLYLFIYLPDTKDAYNRGKAECERDIDTVRIPGKPEIVYRDTTIINMISPVEVTETDSGNINLYSSIDTSIVSGKDTISIQVTNSQELNLSELIESEQGKIKGILAKWFMKVEHKDYVSPTDTIKIFTPKYVTEVKVETNWLITTIAYVAGLVSAIIIFFSTK